MGKKHTRNNVESGLTSEIGYQTKEEEESRPVH